MLRRSRPALTSSTSASATSATTSAPRVRRCPPAVRRDPCCSAVCRSVREACSAGIAPTRTPITVVTVRPKANTVPSRRIAPTRGSPGGLRATSARMPASATIIPTAPPISREQQALGQHLPGQPPPSGAKRRAHRELAAPLRAAGEQQIGDVHAGDREDERHRAEQREQRRPDGARHFMLQRAHDEPLPQRRPRHARKLRQRMPGDRIELGPAPVEPDSRLQTADHPEVVSPLPAVRRQRRAVLERRPDFSRRQRARFQNRAASRRSRESAGRRA